MNEPSGDSSNHDYDSSDGEDNQSDELTDFAMSLKKIPTPVLESHLSEITADMQFVEDQVSLEPGQYATHSANMDAEAKLAALREKVSIIKTEYEKRADRRATG